MKNVNQKLQSLYSGEGSSQANKTSQKDWLNKLEFKLKTVRKYRNFKATANYFNFLSFKNEKKKKKSCNKSVKTSFYYSTQKFIDSITRYFSFSKREFP